MAAISLPPSAQLGSLFLGKELPSRCLNLLDSVSFLKILVKSLWGKGVLALVPVSVITTVATSMCFSDSPILTPVPCSRVVEEVSLKHIYWKIFLIKGSVREEVGK
jgi:hypothetical protein